MGFQLLGDYSETTPVFDLQEGLFIKEVPTHPYYIEGQLAKTTSELMHFSEISELENLALNRTTRRELLSAYQSFMSLHISDFGEIKSLPIIQEILG